MILYTDTFKITSDSKEKLSVQHAQFSWSRFPETTTVSFRVTRTTSLKVVRQTVAADLFLQKGIYKNY